MPAEIVRRVKLLVRQQPANPWLHVYLADALFMVNDVSDALAEGRKAASLDPGCCRILLDLGRQLADMGRINDAERFLAAAPSVINPSAELAQARALDRTGQTARAIEHLSRMRRQVANYCIDLLMGYGYERLGDTTNAHRHYRAAVTLLYADADVGEMPGYPDIGPSLKAAERFLRAAGDTKQAQVLRQEPRLAPFFIDDGNGGGNGR
jgi:Flp pilus assembly protein TadD